MAIRQPARDGLGERVGKPFEPGSVHVEIRPLKQLVHVGLQAEETYAVGDAEIRRQPLQILPRLAVADNVQRGVRPLAKNQGEHPQQQVLAFVSSERPVVMRTGLGAGCLAP